MNKGDEYVSGFNKAIMEIINNLCKKFPNDIDLSISKNRLSIVRREQPDFLITMCGPYLIKYKDSFDENDINNFLTNKIKKEDKEAINQSNDVNGIFNKIRTLLPAINVDEKSFILGKIKEMLKIYLEYLLFLKNNMAN
jgi:hypothetical protein